MNNSPYIVFGEDYDAATLARHLGHLTTNPARPFEFLHPRFDHAVNVSLESKFDNDLNIKASAFRGTQADLMLANVFGLNLTPPAGDIYTIESKTVQVAQTLAVMEYMLQIFLLEASKKGYDLASILSSTEGLYMLVGLRAKVPQKKKEQSGISPDELASASAAQMAVTAGASGHIPGQTKTSMDRSITSLSAVASFIKGERAIAGQYVKLRQTRHGIQLSKARIQLKREFIRDCAVSSAGSKSASGGGDVDEE